MSKAVYIPVRPQLTINATGGRTLGNCYYAHYYEVTSLRRLSSSQLQALRDAGFLGYGQFFYIKSQCDGKEEPAGHDDIMPVNTDMKPHGPGVDWRGNIITKPLRIPYFTYKIESRVDSSD